MRSLFIPLALCVAATAFAQAAPHPAPDSTRSIDPGMSETQVVERLGAPLSKRSDGAHTYLYYRNGCEKTCGMHDLVVLDNNVVVDAIFRSPLRHYTGASSSPAAVPPRRARARRGASGALTVGAPAAPPSANAHPDTARSPADSARAHPDSAGGRGR